MSIDIKESISCESYDSPFSSSPANSPKINKDIEFPKNNVHENKCNYVLDSLIQIENDFDISSKDDVQKKISEYNIEKLRDFATRSFNALSQIRTKKFELENKKSNKKIRKNSNFDNVYCSLKLLRKKRNSECANNDNSITINNYVIKEKILMGNNKNTHNAINMEDNNKYYIKIMDIPNQMTTYNSNYKKLLNVLNTIKNIECCNITKIHEIIETKDKIYVVMNYVEGKVLSLIERHWNKIKLYITQNKL